jgi:hypothetical protein
MFSGFLNNRKLATPFLKSTLKQVYRNSGNQGLIDRAHKKNRGPDPPGIGTAPFLPLRSYRSV